MLGTLRKVQKSVLIVLTIIICVAFGYLYNRYEPDGGAANPAASNNVAFTLEGRVYQGTEAYRTGNLFYVALRDLGITPPFNIQPIGRFALAMFGEQAGAAMFNSGADRSDFVINLAKFRNAAKRLGVAATDEQVQKAIESMTVFQDDAGKFDGAKYRDYLRSILGRFALREYELRELIADFVNFETIQGLIASGHGPTDWEVSRTYQERYEIFTAFEIFLSTESAAKGLKITPEQIKAYYEENKDSFQSEPRRSIRYLKFAIPPKGEKESEGDWQARRGDVAAKFRQAFSLIQPAIEDQDKPVSEAVGAALATDGLKGIKIEETAPFPASEPPKDLEAASEFVDRVFLLDEKDPKAFDTVATEKAIYLYWLKEAPIAPVPLTLEQATKEVQQRLEAQEKDAKLNEAASKIRQQITDSLAKGKSIADAAKAAGVEAKEVKPFDSQQTPEGSSHAPAVKSLASGLVAGQVSEPSIQSDGAVLVYLASRQVPKRDSEPEDRKKIAEELKEAAKTRSFEAWFQARRAESKEKRPLIKDQEGNQIPMSIEYFAPRG